MSVRKDYERIFALPTIDEEKSIITPLPNFDKLDCLQLLILKIDNLEKKIDELIKINRRTVDKG